jgi:hypothetical protein
MDKSCLLNTLAISQSALGTSDLQFLTLKCDLRKNPKWAKNFFLKKVFLPHLEPP